MNNVSLAIESDLLDIAKTLNEVSITANEVLGNYFATGTSTLVDALADGSTPATVSTKLTKSQVQNMIGCLTQIQNFFTNQAVTQGDYLNSIYNVTNGNTAAPAIVSNNLEAIGEKLKAVALTMLGLYPECKNVVSLYNVSELGTALGSISSHIVVFGATSTKAKYLSGIVLAEQFSKLLGNLAVSQADYTTSVLTWVGGE